MSSAVEDGLTGPVIQGPDGRFYREYAGPVCWTGAHWAAAVVAPLTKAEMKNAGPSWFSRHFTRLATTFAWLTIVFSVINAIVTGRSVVTIVWGISISLTLAGVASIREYLTHHSS